MAVFVLDKQKQPLMPCTEKRARLLLERGRAVVVRLAPFTIRLKDRIGGQTQPLRLKLAPGCQTTGLALVRETETLDPETGEVERRADVLWLCELAHCGRTIHQAMETRRNFRRSRRDRKTRFRAPRFQNRTRKEGWLPPSLQHRVDTTTSWVTWLRHLAPITAISQERVRFDTQAMQKPETSGVEYQQGMLAGYEVEHIQLKRHNGSKCPSNLTVACRSCNEQKDDQSVAVFLVRKPAVLKRIQAQTKTPLTDAAAVNATRWALFAALKATSLPLEIGSGGRSKYNRRRLEIPKTHALDAACGGRVDQIQNWNRPVLAIIASGRGAYGRTRAVKNGFPRGYLVREKHLGALPDRRLGSGGRAKGQESWRQHRPGRRVQDRLVQHRGAEQVDRRHLTPLLPPAATCRWLWLFVSTHNGGSERGGRTVLHTARYPSPA